MYKVFLNGIEQSEDDVLNIVSSVKFTIGREDGITSTEQILRERSEAELSFTGAAYSYICSLLFNNPCEIINVTIENCGLVFNGTIDIGMMERTMGVQKCICKTKIKDSSFSSYIRDYLSVDVPLYNTKTKGCLPLATVQRNILMPTDPTTPSTTLQIVAFDVLDVFQYIISYVTDNQFQVVSTFLTNNKYAITTGFNMHLHGATISDTYPTITFDSLFQELRKKLRIFLGIEYDASGRAYLRIENEEYFFEDTELFRIDKLPPNTVQSYDTKRNFQQIDIGSDTFEVQEGNPVYYPQVRFKAFNRESYGGCGSCTAGDKESKLNLVSTDIIDSNVIYEALNWDAGTDYTNDDAEFLFEYYEISGISYGKVDLDAGSGKYFYNASITNEQVLQTWIDYYGKCLAIQRNSKYGMLAQNSDYISTNGGIGYACGDSHRSFGNIIYDNLGSLSTGSYIGYVSPCAATPITDNFTQFTVIETGTYNFASRTVNIKQTNGAFATTDVTYEVHILVFTDNTYGVPIQDFSDSVTVADAFAEVGNLYIETGNIALAVGNVVAIYMKVSIGSGFFLQDFEYTPDLQTFELISDGFACESQEYNNQNSRPYLLDMTDELCSANYKKAQQNPKGYILVAGTKQWIRELTEDGRQMGTYKLMGNDLICNG